MLRPVSASVLGNLQEARYFFDVSSLRVDLTVARFICIYIIKILITIKTLKSLKSVFSI